MGLSFLLRSKHQLINTSITLDFFFTLIKQTMLDKRRWHRWPQSSRLWGLLIKLFCEASWSNWFSDRCPWSRTWSDYIRLYWMKKKWLFVGYVLDKAHTHLGHIQAYSCISIWVCSWYRYVHQFWHIRATLEISMELNMELDTWM